MFTIFTLFSTACTLVDAESVHVLQREQVKVPMIDDFWCLLVAPIAVVLCIPVSTPWGYIIFMSVREDVFYKLVWSRRIASLLLACMRDNISTHGLCCSSLAWTWTLQHPGFLLKRRRATIIVKISNLCTEFLCAMVLIKLYIDFSLGPKAPIIYLCDSNVFYYCFAEFWKQPHEPIHPVRIPCCVQL
jgi:hypothetical protein